jgi:hypothetical protein
MDITNRIYSEKPDISFMLNVLNVHETEEQANRYKKRYGDKVIMDILTLESGKWNIIGPYAENKERIEMYGKNAHILEEILKQRETDSKLGIDLMKKKVITKKRENIKTQGTDDSGLEEYKKLFGSSSTYDVNKELKEPIIDEMDAIEVPVYTISKGGMNITQSKFYSKAEAPVHMKN